MQIHVVDSFFRLLEVRFVETFRFLLIFLVVLIGLNWTFDAISSHQEHQKRVCSINFIQFEPPGTSPRVFYVQSDLQLDYNMFIHQLLSL